MTKHFRLVGLDCPDCASKIEYKVKKLIGVKDVSLNFLTTKISIEMDDSIIEDIEKSLINIVSKYESNVEIRKA